MAVLRSQPFLAQTGAKLTNFDFLQPLITLAVEVYDAKKFKQRVGANFFYCLLMGTVLKYKVGAGAP